MNLKDKTVCIVDNGLFVDFARVIARGFGRAYYHSPSASAFVKSNALVVGDGYDELERTAHPLAIADRVDLWVFLDLYHWDLQQLLVERGARVWGARRGEGMELHRWEFKQMLKKLGLPVQPMEHIIGLDGLRDRLRVVKDKFVKTSYTRGDMETWRHQDYPISEPRLDELEHALGAKKHRYEFIVEDEIPDCVEIGYDGFSIDGQFPSPAMMAYEIKDMGMMAAVKSYNSLAAPVRTVNTALRPALAEFQYRGFLSTEIRYGKERKPYFIDPCCRLGTPSNELLQTLFTNWPETIWAGAGGELVAPKPVAKFGVLAMIHSEWAVKNWVPLEVPAAADPWVKLRMRTRIEGKEYVVPQGVDLSDIGAVVGTGNTLLEAVKACREHADLIKGYGIEVDMNAIGQALDQVRAGEKLGIQFTTETLPTAEELKKAVG